MRSFLKISSQSWKNKLNGLSWVLSTFNCSILFVACYMHNKMLTCSNFEGVQTFFSLQTAIVSYIIELIYTTKLIIMTDKTNILDRVSKIRKSSPKIIVWSHFIIGKWFYFYVPPHDVCSTNIMLMCVCVEGIIIPH